VRTEGKGTGIRGAYTKRRGYKERVRSVKKNGEKREKRRRLRWWW
jgi:hypothetical protein